MIDNSIFQYKKVAYHTLGCKLNFAETSAIGKQLSDQGYQKIKTGEEADICIINTCSVTDTADNKCRQAIKRINRQHPNAVLIVTGCYAQLQPDEIAAIEGVDLVLGANDKFKILDFIKQLESTNIKKIQHTDIQDVKKFSPSCSSNDRTRYFLKVQDGCDYYCTYCTIPFARGRSRNASVADTVKEAQKAIQSGAKEIVLSGVNIGDFGVSTEESFFELVKALDQLSENIRFRISSIEPNLLSDELIEYIATSNHFMPHFHIPLQSGSNPVLRLMKRRYTTEMFAQKINTIKRRIPQAFIGVDVIVGVRGETDELFENSFAFISSLPISQLHVFTYSERTGTQMLNIEHAVSKTERKRRSEIIHTLSEQLTTSFYNSQIGRISTVLWENRHAGDSMVGFTDNYIRVETPFNKSLINTIQTIELGDWNEDKTALTVMHRQF